MAGIRLLPEESTFNTLLQSDLFSDDDRSDSWSIKSDYGSTLDDDRRPGNAFDYGSDKEEPDADGRSSALSLQSYWDIAYAGELTNFREHGHAGEVWFGSDVMHMVASWTRSLCVEISRGPLPTSDHFREEPTEDGDKSLCDWNVLDIGTGNDLTRTDYSEGEVDLVRSLSNRDGHCMVDDVLESKLDTQFRLVMDKGTLDAIGLHHDGPIKRIMYWDSVSKLVASSGMLVITSCNSTKDELLQEVENYNRRGLGMSSEPDVDKIEDLDNSRHPPFRYINHIRSYPTFTLGGVVGSRVATVAFLRN